MNQDEVIRKIRRDLMDGYDEELEMEMEDHELDAMMLDTGIAQGSDEEKNARRQYFQELFRLQGELVKLQDWVVHTQAQGGDPF